MKTRFAKIVVASAIIMMAGNAWAQSSPTDAMFETYGSKEGFTTVQVAKELFSMFAEISKESTDAEIKELESVLNKLDYIRVLMYDTQTKKGDIYNQFRKDLDGIKLQGFTELMIVKESGNEFKFMVKKAGSGKISELLLLIRGAKESGFVSITGDIDMKSIAKLSKSMNIKGLENLDKIQKK